MACNWDWSDVITVERLGGYVRWFPYVKGSTLGDSFCNNIFLMRFTNKFDLIYERIFSGVCAYIWACACVWQWKGISGSRWKEGILLRLYIFVRIKSVCLRVQREWKCRNHYNYHNVKIDFRTWLFSKFSYFFTSELYIS